jgi:hypothetical protein
MQRIFLYLDVKSRLRASEVCKRWNRLNKDPYVWQGIIKGAPLKISDLKKILQANEKTKSVTILECSAMSKQSVYKSMVKIIAVTTKMKTGIFSWMT